MRAVLKFFLLTYAVTWTCFIAAVEISRGTASALAAVRGPLLLLGTFAPAIVAIWLTARNQGAKGTTALLSPVFEWRVSWKYYLFAVGYMLCIKLGVAVVHRWLTGSWPRFGNESWYVIAVAIVISTPFQSGEEIGWRGYALPRLASRLGFGRASLLLGVIWAFWHLPLFYLRGADTYGQSFPVWALGVTALSVAITWIFARTGGSLLLTMVMHSAVNQTLGIVPDAVAKPGKVFTLAVAPPFLITVALLWIPAVYFLFRMPGWSDWPAKKNLAMSAAQ